jgi:hypothetical protein
MAQTSSAEAHCGNFDPAEVPPCYWSINAFSDPEIPVEKYFITFGSSSKQLQDLTNR